MNDALACEFSRYACQKLEQNLGQIRRCVGLLDEAQLWQRRNAHCNSVGNLVLHLAGNVHEWINAGLGGDVLSRNRAAEFAERGPLPGATILARLEATVRRACQVLEGLDAADLAQRRRIQAYDVATIVAVTHVVEHFSFHTGQIVHETKALRDCDLSLYDERGHKPGGNQYP